MFCSLTLSSDPHGNSGCALPSEGIGACPSLHVAFRGTSTVVFYSSGPHRAPVGPPGLREACVLTGRDQEERNERKVQFVVAVSKATAQ